jgi:hypothetical protein
MEFILSIRTNKGDYMNKLLTMVFAAALLTACAAPVSNERNEKIVFVTSTSFNGNIGGVTGADAKCQIEADGQDSIVPTGTYFAWLSDETQSPDTRFTKSSHPYVLADGTRIADDYADLTDGSILHPINVEASGNTLGLNYIWTGTNSDGTAQQSFVTCNGWMAEPLRNFKGSGGRTNRVDSLWSNRIARVSCSRKLRLWCFQQ